MRRFESLILLVCVILIPFSAAVVSPSSFVSLGSSVSSSSVDFELSSVDAITFDTVYFSVDGGSWQSFDLVGSGLSSGWLSGSSSGSFSIDRSGVDRSVYVIIFTCSLDDDAWDCHGGDWQLLEGVVPAVDSSPPVVDGSAWSDPSTWSSMGQSMPQQGDVVTIPQGERVVLDVSPPSLDGIMVHGVLEFAATDLAVTTDFIKVMGDGAELLIGTESEPFTGDAVITLTGSEQEVLDAEANDDNHCGSKVICSMGGGRLEMISDYQGPSWTRLKDGFTADVGDTTITLEENVGWQVGDEIVIVSTDFDPGQAEKRTITSVSGNVVSFAEPLEFMHYGQIQNIEGYSVDQRAEVIHLTRNIKIQGDSSSTDTLLGGHVMAMNEHHMMQEDMRKNQGKEYVDMWEDMPNDLSIVPKIDGVELYRMGQQGILARYPWHWHLYGDASGSYVRNTAVHDSFQRCYTIHGAQNALLEDSVAYNVVGHCVFLEDGAEWDNTIRRNAIALVRMFQHSDDWLIESDELPSAFWWSNTQNDIYDNVAAGGFGIGFWQDPKSRPDGPSATDSIDLNDIDEGQWGDYSGNVAHSFLRSEHEKVENFERVTTHVKSVSNFRGSTGFMLGDDRRNRVGDNNPQEADCNTVCDVDNLQVHHATTGFKAMRTFTQRPINSLFSDVWEGIITVNNNNEDANVVIAYTNNRGNVGAYGQGSVDFADKWIDEAQEANQLSNQLGRTVPMPLYGGMDQQWGINWKYDGGNSRDHVFINFHDEASINRGAVATSVHTHGLLMRASTLINSDAYVAGTDDPSGSVLKDIDGSLSGTGEYSEYREATGPLVNLLYDDTCELGHDGTAWALCAGVSGKISFGTGGADIGVVEHVRLGNTMALNADGFTQWLPLYETYLMGTPLAKNSVYMASRDVGIDQWWIFAFESTQPLSPVSAEQSHNQFYKDDDIERATTAQQLCSSDASVTVYYDPSRQLQYVKMFGGADLDVGFMNGDKWKRKQLRIASHESADLYESASQIVQC